MSFIPPKPSGFIPPAPILASEMLARRAAATVPAGSVPATAPDVPATLELTASPAIQPTPPPRDGLLDPVSEAELLRRAVANMTDDAKQLTVARVRQHLLDFKAERTIEPVPLKDIRLAVAIACSTYIPVVPAELDAAGAPVSKKAATSTKKKVKPTVTVDIAAMFAALHKGPAVISLAPQPDLPIEPTN